MDGFAEALERGLPAGAEGVADLLPGVPGAAGVVHALLTRDRDSYVK
jgi:hypothetical protein